jgi:hypothetical protein
MLFTKKMASALKRSYGKNIEVLHFNWGHEEYGYNLLGAKDHQDTLDVDDYSSPEHLVGESIDDVGGWLLLEVRRYDKYDQIIGERYALFNRAGALVWDGKAEGMSKIAQIVMEHYGIGNFAS